MLVIGSTALRHWFFDVREPKDYDVYLRTDETYLTEARGFPGKLEWFAHPDLDVFLPPLGTAKIADPNWLYTIKAAHAYWELRDGSWDKHMNDLLFLTKHKALLLPNLHDRLRAIWTEVHGEKRVNLEMEAADFFNDAVERVYDHDSIHESVAYGDRPLYEQILRDGSTVAVDSNKLLRMPYEDKIKLFREEIYATALERLIIPSNYTESPTKAYRWALRRTITSLTKGDSAQFIVTNYERFYRREDDYVGRHLANKHRLRPYEGKY